jgi:phage tail-like protein
MAARASPYDFYPAFAYSVAISQRVVAGFNEVSGLMVETEVETFREGGLNGCERQLPGPSKFPSRLVLKRGIGDLSYFWQWYLGVTKGQIERRDVTIVMNDADGTPGFNWLFREACPVKWTGPELRANNSAIAFEAIELIHRGVSSGQDR